MNTLADPAVRVTLIRRFDRLTPQTSARWGTMSSTQMLRHLVLAFRMAMGECAVADAASRKFDNPLVRFVALTLPIPWPKGIKTVPEIDCAALRPSSVDFADEHAKIAVAIRCFGEVSAANLCSTHPMFGSLNRSQWMRWGFRHTDHHLRQFGC
ncbi:DUF1569 domain-containing protein [Edaphobacter dinghuensis]|uniref:DUF1569 domain-containing protein n=1 Tax=Edaphobacter dinghuensis TaxID=1560005 RepID=UPI00166686F3|nr:DUF1569 domain-containing protein [Edaphobacter dinghuensis]